MFFTFLLYVGWIPYSVNRYPDIDVNETRYHLPDTRHVPRVTPIRDKRTSIYFFRQFCRVVLAGESVEKMPRYFSRQTYSIITVYNGKCPKFSHSIGIAKRRLPGSLRRNSTPAKLSSSFSAVTQVSRYTRSEENYCN